MSPKAEAKIPIKGGCKISDFMSKNQIFFLAIDYCPNCYISLLGC